MKWFEVKGALVEPFHSTRDVRRLVIGDRDRRISSDNPKNRQDGEDDTDDDLRLLG